MTDLQYAGDDLSSEFETDAAPRPPSDAELGRVAALGEELAALDARIARGEALLKELKEARRLIAEGTLPEAMDAVGARGLRDFTLNDGSRVSVALKYRCSQLDDLPNDPKREDRRPLDERVAALSWLSHHGHGDLVRRTITIILGKGSAEAEAAIASFFASLRLNSARYSAANVVPWNTLSAFTRDLDARAGAEDAVPLDLLGVTKLRIAEVRTPREKDTL
jgi:uncharacterized small protein (DUF1192 family)